MRPTRSAPVVGYAGVCNNKSCNMCGERVPLGGDQPDRAPACDECGEELQVFAPPPERRDDAAA